MQKAQLREQMKAVHSDLERAETSAASSANCSANKLDQQKAQEKVSKFNKVLFIQ